jgi:Zn-dependent protease with chaperone function
MAVTVGLLGALLLGVGWLVVALLDAPLWFPAGFAIGVTLLQYLVAPWFIRALIPAREVARADGGYLPADGEARLAAIVARRAGDAGVPLPRLGIVDDGTPNAFAFGRTPAGGHVWVSRGLLDRLDDDELDAVVAHEVGHIKHWDMVVMTVAAVVPLVLYMVHVVTRRFSRPEARAVAIASYIAYLVGQLAVLAVSRARELKADDWSRRCTLHGDALASALVKIAYGIGEVDAERRREAQEEDRKGRARLKALTSGGGVGAAQILGIMSSRDGRRMAALLTDNAEGSEAAVAGLRWDRTNPWARWGEKLSTHPLVATRIARLGRPGPGASTHWAAVAAAATGDDDEVRIARRRFAGQLALALAPWVVMLPVFALAYVTRDPGFVPWALLVGGALLFVKQRLRYPSGYEPVGRVTALLGRLDAGPVFGLPVEVRGRILGRGVPGYVLSPDLVVQDESGFVPLVYTNPLPLARGWFGLFRSQDFLDRDVTARGWYLRGTGGPRIELRDVVTQPGDDVYGPRQVRRARGWAWAVNHLFAALVFAVGVVWVLAVSTT